MWTRLGVDPLGVAAVVVAAVGVYVAFLVLVRLFGQRPLARMSTSDVIVVVALGSVAGRVVLGTSVTLLAGVVALLVLFVLRWVAERIGATRWGRWLVRDRPVLLMAAGAPQRDLMHRSRVSEDELAGVLRTAGIRDRREVACVVLEATGALSVVRHGQPLERALFAEVVGVERLPEEVFRAG